MFKHVIVALLSLVVLAGVANAQTGHGGGGQPDPYRLSYRSTPTVPLKFKTSCDTYGRKPTSLQGINPLQRTLVIIQAGQSNNLNTAPSAFTPVNVGKIDNMSICDGGIYPVPSDPLIGGGCDTSLTGCNTSDCASTGCLGNAMTRVADLLLSQGKFDRVIIEPISIGSSPVQAWAPGGGLSDYNNRFAVALRRLNAKGINTSNATIVVSWGQGETDCGLGTTQVSYVSSFNAMVAAAGPLANGVRWFVNQETWDTVTPGLCPVIQNAQAANAPSGVINHAAQIWAGENFDAKLGSVCNGGLPCRQAEGLHATDALNIDYATDLVAAFHSSGLPF